MSTTCSNCMRSPASRMPLVVEWTVDIELLKFVKRQQRLRVLDFGVEQRRAEICHGSPCQEANIGARYFVAETHCGSGVGTGSSFSTRPCKSLALRSISSWMTEYLTIYAWFSRLISSCLLLIILCRRNLTFISRECYQRNGKCGDSHRFVFLAFAVKQSLEIDDGDIAHHELSGRSAPGDTETGPNGQQTYRNGS